MAGLQLSGLTKGFGAHKVIEGLDLSVRDGEHLTVFGPSGCGKSLLLRLIAGVYEPDAGDIVVGNRSIVDLAPEHRDIGMAFQTFALYPHLTAEQNIASPLEARASKTRDEQVRRVARLLKIEHVLSHRPRELSNGQKQRTALSRALVAEPKLLLLDDPLRNVDAKLRYEMRLELPRLLRASGATVLYVTQDYREAMALGDRIAVILKGRIVQLADPVTIYDAPASIEVARLFGDPTINLIEAEARGGRVSLAGVDVDLLDVPDGPVTLGIRPQHMSVRPGADGPSLPADLLAVNPFNERVVYFMTLPNGGEVLASAPSSEGRELAPGPVHLTFDPQAVLAFDTATGLRIGAPAGRA